MTSPLRHALRLSTAALATLGAASVACAQTASAPLVSLGTTPLAGVAVGNGVHQSQPVVDTFKGTQAPLVGVGALSGRPAHDGSLASVSVLNSNRLLGVSTGPVGSNGVNIANPTGKPVLSGLAK